jgi:hypothetical protein
MSTRFHALRLVSALTCFGFVALAGPSGALAGGGERVARLPGPLSGVDAIAVNDIWAVGTKPDPADPDENIGLAEHWDGATWTDVSTPNFGELTGGLVDVSGSSSSDVWAVGSQGQRSFNDTQIAVEHWNGSAWSRSPAPDASFNDALFGVAAFSPANAWAVGGWDTGGTGLNHTLIEHWNGSAWSIVPTPDDPPGRLDAVDGVGPNDVWAVGGAGGKGIAMHYDGTAWSIVPTPVKGSASQSLSDVSARGSNDVWAVGTVEKGYPFKGQTLAMHWDGSGWRIKASPTPSSGDTVTGVATLTGGKVWMVGTYYPDAFTNKPLTELFANGSWKVVPVRGKTSLDGVAALTADDVWAVGSSIIHWDGTTWRLVVPG